MLQKVIQTQQYIQSFTRQIPLMWLRIEQFGKLEAKISYAAWWLLHVPWYIHKKITA